MSFHLQPLHDALFLDIDGTLLDIASTPDAVVVPESLKQHLAGLYEKLNGALALISGRTIDNIDALFHPLQLPASGVHGAEWRIESERKERRPLPDHIRHAVCERMQACPGIFIEDKKYAMAVHYRNMPELKLPTRRFLENLVAGSLEKLMLMSGKMVWEVVYPGHHKGTAIERFMMHKPFTGRRPVFLGDDETDVFAIRTCERLGGVAARVGQKEDFLSTPRDVRQWLREQVQ